MNLLFVCKHNVFRSKIAEAYFNKINRNKNITASSAGIIKADILSKDEKELIKFQRKTAKEFEISVENGSQSLSISLLKEQDMIVIVADDVPLEIFNSKFYMKGNLKVVVWKIMDAKGEKNDKLIIKKSIKEIIKKVDNLARKLK